VEKIGLSFQSINHYLGSYKYPILEETRASLCSSMEVIDQAPYGRVAGLQLAKPFKKKNDDEMDKPLKNKLYNLKIDGWKNRFVRGEPYKTLPGDVLVLADCKPESANDLQRFGRMWCFLSIVKTDENDGDNVDSVCHKVIASQDLDLDELIYKSLYIVFLTNVGSNRKIWSALHMTSGNLKLFKQILCKSDDMVKASCGCISLVDTILDDCSYQRLLSGLNESQNKAISDSLSGIHCNHSPTMKLVWGPPGTGKTKTLGTLLYILMKMKYRILVCAPTNVAIKEVASRVLHVVREELCSQSGDLFFSPADMLLLGNNERLDVGGEEVEDIFLDNRVQQLWKCLSSHTGWKYCFRSLITLLNSCVSLYYNFFEKEMQMLRISKSKSKPKSFLEYLRDEFLYRSLQLKDCISSICNHVPMYLILEHNYRNLACLNETLDSFQHILFEENLPSEVLKRLFANLKMPEDSSWYFKNSVAQQIFKKRNQCLSALETAQNSLYRLDLIKFTKDRTCRDFCFENSSIIFCTTSSSFRLHAISMKPMNLLVIDEAAQLKECESIIPLQLPGISHAILVGDECQLHAMVRSNVCNEAGLARSLFERLSLLGTQKNLLNMQHRMHPEISLFPNSYFYLNKIRDAPNVERNYGKQYLPGAMFGPYSFINVAGGREEFDDNGISYKNMAEVAVVMTILKKVHKAWIGTKEKLSIGVVSPYAGQVLKIQEKLGKMSGIFHDGFNVNVKTIDGFQGGEQDIVILSTVRTNYRTSLQFVSSPQRTNVALTRARALSNNDNVWKSLVNDSKNRGFFFHADQDTEMAKAISDSMKELDQSFDLLQTNSILFRNTMWKVHFSDRFKRSFEKVWKKKSKDDSFQKKVFDVLVRLANGWRPRGRTIELACEISSHILKQFKVETHYIICSVEIVKDLRCHIQVLKMWDLVPVEDIPQVAKRRDCEFRRYTDEYIAYCKEKGSDGYVHYFRF
ncbi:regulator of nonsense transcripts-like protein, partial [Trifolium pratense]